MADGFLQTSDMDMENVGDQYLNVLLHSSLLQVVDRDEYGNIKHCIMHDLVHDVASSILGFRRVDLNISDDIYPSHYIRWRDASSNIPKEQAKSLRTLFLEDGGSDIKFSDFESLRALTLKRDHVPDSIRELIHLRYFHLLGVRTECLPNWIGDLYHLQTLRAEPEKLPSTLTHLINLRHLHVPPRTKLPPHMGRLTSLRTLQYFHVGDEDGYLIEELGSLKYLKGELMIDNLEKVQGEEDSKKADLSQKSGIVRLALSWRGRWKRREGDKDVLNGLQPHTSLMFLEIDGFSGIGFPAWTSKMAVCLQGQWVGLNNLMEIKISDCSECEEIPSMGQLPRLKSLYLCDLWNLKTIGSSFYGIEHCNETISVFPALERLVLWNMRNLTDWEEVEIPSGGQVEVFPCLTYLKIRDCIQLRSAPSQFTCLKELIVDQIKSGSPFVSICGNKLKTLRELKIWNLNGLTCLPHWLFYNNQQLSTLEILDCSSLMQLPDGMHSLNSLIELDLRECKSLRSIPYSMSGGLQSLRRLTIRGCPKLMDFPIGMVESGASFLERLSIHIGESDSWHCELFKKSLNGVLRLGSQSLGRLELRGDDWESLPDQLQHLTALSELWLCGFEIHALPEWFGNLSSLCRLRISHCRKLKHLPSVETMRRLTRLAHLFVDNSPSLEERCTEQQSVDSEWPKICHLPDIRIGGRQIRSGGQRSNMVFGNGFAMQCSAQALWHRDGSEFWSCHMWYN